MAEELHIRPVRVDDADELNQMRRQPAWLRFTSVLPSERPEQTRRILESLGPRDHMFVAELEGRIVGMAGLHGREGKERHMAVLGIGVHETFAGRGIARALITTLLDLADGYLALTRIELDVYADNDRALRLYERMGFQREGVRRKALFRDGKLIDAVLLSRIR